MKKLNGTKVLVTGGSGFIASHLVRQLVKLGAEVAIVTKYDSIIDNVRLADVWNDIIVLEADLRNADALQKVSKFKPQIIYHMAAYNHVGDSFQNASEALDSNSKGTANLFQAYNEFEHFIYLSTSEVYGFQEPGPFVETMTPRPVSPYSIGKYSGELFAQMLARDLGKPVSIVRPFNTFGPYQSVRAVIPELIVKCLKGDAIRSTEGIQTREFNFVSNIVDALMTIGFTDKVIGTPVNIGGGEEIAIRDLIKLIHKLTNSTSDLQIGALENRPTEIWRMRANAELAKDLIGWTPAINLMDGLELTIDWFREYLSLYHSPDQGLCKLANFQRPDQ